MKRKSLGKWLCVEDDPESTILKVMKEKGFGKDDSKLPDGMTAAKLKEGITSLKTAQSSDSQKRRRVATISGAAVSLHGASSSRNDAAMDVSKKQRKHADEPLRPSQPDMPNAQTASGGAAASACSVSTSQSLKSPATSSVGSRMTFSTRVYVDSLMVWPTSQCLQTFVSEHFHSRAVLRSLDAGGDGDCLFHSIGAGLAYMLNSNGPAAAHLRDRCSEFVLPLTKSRLEVVRHLRNLTATGVMKSDDTDFLNLLVSASLQEKGGVWHDRWSPSRLLFMHSFGELVGCDAVRAVGPNPSPNAESGDIIVALTRTIARPNGGSSDEMYLPVIQGESLLVALRLAVQEELRVCGDHHWGTVLDCAAISDQLDIGLLIFADKLQCNGSQCLVNVDAVRGDFSYYLALWWDEPTHFRLAQYREARSRPWCSFWAADELPSSLRTHYDVCNPSAPVGSARRLAIR